MDDNIDNALCNGHVVLFDDGILKCSTLNATNKLRNFGTLFGRNVAPLLKVKLLKL